MANIETNRIENKEKLNEDFEQEVIAFLNYREGGIIYVGIRKDGQVVGVKDIDDKQIIKVVISSGTEKPYYLRKKGRTPEGCYIRIGSGKEQMTFDMIDEMYSRRVKTSLKELESPRQDLTFRQLKIYYEENGMKLNDNFAKNLNLLTSDGKYNYNAFLLADENNISIKLVKYLGTNKMELIENHEYGYCCIITATHRILERLVAENTVYAKIEYNGRKEVEMIDSKALKEAVINAIVHSDYTYNTSPIVELYSDRIEITSGGGLPQELSQEEFLEGVTAPRNKDLIRVFKDVDLIENIGSGVLRILDAYDKSCFIFMDHFLRVSFKYRENPFEYDEKTNKKTDKKTDKKTNKKIKNKPQEKELINFCKKAKTLKEITIHFGFKDITTFKKNYINPLLENGSLQLTIPEQPRNRNQKYIAK